MPNQSRKIGSAAVTLALGLAVGSPATAGVACLIQDEVSACFKLPGIGTASGCKTPTPASCLLAFLDSQGGMPGRKIPTLRFHAQGADRARTAMIYVAGQEFSLEASTLQSFRLRTLMARWSPALDAVVITGTDLGGTDVRVEIKASQLGELKMEGGSGSIVVEAEVLDVADLQRVTSAGVVLLPMLEFTPTSAAGP